MCPQLRFMPIWSIPRNEKQPIKYHSNRYNYETRNHNKQRTKHPYFWWRSMDDHLGTCRLVLYNGWSYPCSNQENLENQYLKSHEVCKYIKLENGNNADVYNLDMVVALSYQIDTGHSIVFREWLINKVARNQDYNILLYLNKGTNHTLYC